MTNPEYTHLTLVIDRSGSMATIASDMEGGVNAMLAEQRAVPGKLTVSLIRFDAIIEDICRMVPVEAAPRFHLDPRGRTALWDAMGYAISVTGRDLEALPEDQRPGKVIVITVTDGAENASVEWSGRRVMEAVKHQREVYDWDFQFLGADEHSLQGHDTVGAGSSHTFAPTAAGTAHLTQSTSAGLTTYRTLGRYVHGGADANGGN